MKGKKLLTALLTLALGVSIAVGLAGCDKSYNSEETDALLAQLQTTIDGNKTELNGKIAALEQDYKAKDSELQASILANTQALATLKAEYESKVAELKQADADNAEAFATLKTEYENKVKALEKADQDNAIALAVLKADYESKVKALEQADKDNASALAALKAEYESKVKALEQADKDNTSALATLKTDYEAKVAELTKADNANKQAIADLDTKYKAEVEELTASNQANAEALATLKADYESKVKALEQADKDNASALATLKADYESKVKELEEADKDNASALATLKTDYTAKVADLQGEIDTANKTIADNKTALETAIATLKATYDEKLDEVEALIDTIQSTDTTQDEKIVALQQQAADLITRLAEMEKATTIVSVAFNDDGDLVITFADGSTQIAQAPQTHVHSFGDWVSYNQIVIQPHCENRLFYRVCSSCYQIEWKQGSYDDHSWKVVTTAPTCQAQGYNTNTCTICGKVEVDNYTPIADHAWAEEYSFDNSYHWYDCDTCDEIKDKAEHDVLSTGECSICNALVGATEGVLYDISADGTYAEVIGYEGTATRVRIADTYENLPVKVIYDKAFENKSIVSVVIPDSVTTIGGEAFHYCRQLTSVVIGDSVTTMGIYAFGGCESLTSVVFPDSVTTIGHGAFDYCHNLKSVVMSEGVQVIGYGAFPTHQLVYNEYDNCKYLGNAENPYIALIKTDDATISNCTIAEGTKVLAENAFAGCGRLTNIMIPDSVEVIGGSAFLNCDSLKTVVIGDGVKTVGDKAFAECNNLKSIVVGESVESFDKMTFVLSDSLSAVYYKGTEDQWNQIDYASSDYINYKPRYYYIENQTDVPTDGGNYWHYNENGEIVVWETDNTPEEEQPEIPNIDDPDLTDDTNGDNGIWFPGQGGTQWNSLDVVSISTYSAGQSLDGFAITAVSVRIGGDYEWNPCGLRFKTDVPEQKETYEGAICYTVITLTIDDRHFCRAISAQVWRDMGDGWNTVVLDIPEPYYTLDITAQSFIVVSETEIYQTNAVTSSLAYAASWGLNRGSTSTILYAYTAGIIDGITLNQTSATLALNDTITLSAVTQPVGYCVVWTSSNTDIATVDYNGKVTAVGEGTATITATMGGVATTCEVNIMNQGEAHKPAPSSLQEDIAYMIRVNNANGPLYVKGSITNGRFDCSTTAAEAVSVYVQNVDGGQLLYMLNDTDKVYFVFDDSSYGASTTSDASIATVFEWNAKLNTLVVAEDNNNRAFGAHVNHTGTACSAYDSSQANYNWGEFIAVGV